MSSGDPARAAASREPDALEALRTELYATIGRSDAVLGAISDGVVVRDAYGALVSANPAALEILGLTFGQIAGHEPLPIGWTPLAEDGEAPLPERIGCEALRTGRAIRNRIGAIRRAGEEQLVWLSMSAVPLSSEGAFEGTSEGASGGCVITFRDVTVERATRTRELDEARLEGLDRRMNEIELVMRRDGSIVHANDHALAAYGYGADEIRHLNIRNLRASETLNVIDQEMDRAAHDGIRFESVHRRRDGSRFPVEVSSRGVEVAGVRYLHSLVRDLTEAREIERERRELEGKVAEALRDRELILRHSPIGIAKARGRELIWINRRWEELFGYSATEIVGKTSRIFYPDGGAFERAGSIIFPALERDRSCRLELEMQRRDGSRFTASLAGSALEPFAERHESIWTVEDVTDQRRSETALAESEERLRSIFATLNQGVVLVDTAGAIVASNEAAGRILGYSQEELRGRATAHPHWGAIRDDGSAFPDGELPALVTLRTGKSLSGVILGIATPEGERRWISITSEPLRHSPGEAPHAVVVGFVDITELRASREELRRTADELREALDRVRTLSGLVPICAYCHKIRDDRGFWDRLEEYLSKHTDAVLSHGMCPDCFARYAPPDSTAAE